MMMIQKKKMYFFSLIFRAKYYYYQIHTYHFKEEILIDERIPLEYSSLDSMNYR